MNKYFPLAIVTVCEATIGIFVKLTGDTIPIFTLNFYRLLFAFLLIAAVMPLIDKKFWKISKKEVKPVVIIGALIGLQITFFNTAMKFTAIANAVIFWSIYPFFVFILSTLFLNERPTKNHVLIFILAFIGLIIAKPFSSAGGELVNILGITIHTMTLGNIIALADAFVFACLITYMRFEDRTKSSGILFWFMFFAVIFTSPALLIFGPGNLAEFGTYVLPLLSAISLPKIIWPISLGMVSTGLAYLFITFALQRIDANIYSLVDTIISPVAAAFFGFIILREVPSSDLIYGGSIILLSGFWLTSNLSGKKMTQLLHFSGYFDKIKKKVKSLY